MFIFLDVLCLHWRVSCHKTRMTCKFITQAKHIHCVIPVHQMPFADVKFSITAAYVSSEMLSIVVVILP